MSLPPLDDARLRLLSAETQAEDGRHAAQFVLGGVDALAGVGGAAGPAPRGRVVGEHLPGVVQPPGVVAAGAAEGLPKIVDPDGQKPFPPGVME